MPNHISQVNASRGGRGPVHDGKAASRPVPGEVVSDWTRTRAASPKERWNPLNPETGKRRKMHEEHKSKATERGLDFETDLGGFQADTDLETMKTAIKMDALRQDAILHTQIAQGIAKMKQMACAEAMHYGKNLAVYGSNLVKFIDRGVDTEEIDPEIAADYKGMVRRLSRGAMIDWESGALGVDFDPSMFGGQA